MYVSAARSQPRPALPFVPFQLHNETGTPLFFLAAGADGPPAVLEPGESASLLSFPGGKIVFDGFQLLEVKPPFRERYRVWLDTGGGGGGFTGGGSGGGYTGGGSGTPILSVLAESHRQGASALLRFHSTIYLRNTCPDEVSLQLRAAGQAR